MLCRIRAASAAIVAAALLGACGLPAASSTHGAPAPLDGAALAVPVGGHRVAVAGFLPPASLLLVRVDGGYAWVSPSLSLRNVTIQDEVNGQPAGTRTLDINGRGTADAYYTFSWSR